MPTMTDNRSALLLDEIAALEKRVSILEEKRGKSPSGSENAYEERSIPSDEFTTSMMVHAIALGFRSTTFKRVPKDYYDWPLEKRRAILSAYSTKHLTKSLVLRDHKHTGEHSHNGRLEGAKYVCVVVQYGRKVDTDLLARAVGEARKKNAAKCNFRLVDDCIGITGYEPGAVTPLNLRTEMPVIVDKAISELPQGTFWLGGGEVDVKWRVQWSEFCAAFRPTIGRVSAPDDE